MLCEHLEQLHDYIKQHDIEIGGLDMLRIVCKKCQVQHECPEISAEYWQVEPKIVQINQSPKKE